MSEPAKSETSRATRRHGWFGAVFVATVIGAYYWAYVLSSRQIGQLDPDRHYHLGLSRLMAEHGLLRTLPQVEDLGWGNYFPDKEFLFHVLTGAAYWLGRQNFVLALVPVLGMAVLLLIYLHLIRVLRPSWSAVIVVSVFLLTAAFTFRLSLVRPHLLAILCFTWVVISTLEKRPVMVGLASAAFALSYHAFYVIGLVAGLQWFLRNRAGFEARAWLWCLGGLAAGILLNPYFPSNVEMGMLTLKLALGSEPLPFGQQGRELETYSWAKLMLAYGYVPAAAIASVFAMRIGTHANPAVRNRLLFLIVLTLGFWILGARSPRAMEYAIPACILMVGYSASLVNRAYWIAMQIGLLLGIQGYVATMHYYRSWHPARPVYEDYALLLETIPRSSPGAKVFHCEWEAGSYILDARPDLRFVTLLEPALLWNASREKYSAMEGLNEGAFSDPHAVLRGAFKADYVICSSQPLIRQMDAHPEDFSTLPGTRGDKLRLFAVRPD